MLQSEPKNFYMKKIFLLVSLIILSCANNDGECHNSVKLINNSTKVIYFGGKSDAPVMGANPLLAGEYFRILPGETKKDIFGRDRGCYEDLFSENNNKLYYTFFDEQVLLNNTWDYIRENELILARYGYSVEQMNEAEWTITYDDN